MSKGKRYSERKVKRYKKKDKKNYIEKNTEKYSKKGIKRSSNKFWAFLLFIVFLIMFIYSGIIVLKYLLNNNENKKIFEDISELITIVDNDLEEYKIDFAKLKNRNPDTVGFLKVKGTNIESVVVKGKDNSYYLNHNFEKKENVAGWIFADYNNKIDGTDKNIIIYGHNMRNGTMFASLKNILNAEWQKNKENRKVVFITENDSSIYEVFSVYQVENEDYYVKTNFKKRRI